MSEGFLKLSRKLLEHQFWKEDRIYSKAEAWIDLLFSATFDASTTVQVKGQDIEVLKGELVASRRYLEQRWNWGSTKVTSFLNYLKKKGMIKTRQTRGQTIVTIVKYRDYNETQTSNRTRAKPKPNQIKESKERKEIDINAPEVKKNEEYSEQQFLQRWKDARLHYDKKPTNISKLKTNDLSRFRELKETYNSEDFNQAIAGLFYQKTFPSTRIQPSHFLENFEQYLTCWQTKEKLFEKEKTKKQML